MEGDRCLGSYRMNIRVPDQKSNLVKVRGTELLASDTVSDTEKNSRGSRWTPWSSSSACSMQTAPCWNNHACA